MLDFKSHRKDTDINQGSQAEDSLIFPSDFEKNIYPECIKFGIYERDGLSITDAKKFVESTASDYKDRVIQIYNERNGASNGDLNVPGLDNNVNLGFGQGEFTTGLPPSGRTKKDSTLSSLAGDVLDQNLNQNKVYGEGGDQSFIESNASALEARKGLATKLKRNIFLNMPNTVSFNESAAWEGAEMGIVGALLEGDSGGAKNQIAAGMLGHMSTAAGAGIGALGGKLFGALGMGSLIGAATGMMGKASLADKFSSLTNRTTNPFKEQTFNGVDFRKFSFSFKFEARNETDLMTIRNIIQAFRAYSKPSFGTGDSDGMFKYPHEFHIEFLTTDINGSSWETNEWLPALKYCVCTGIKTDFGEGTWKSFQGGHPTQISLSLDFAETEIITEQDVFGVTTVGRFKGGNKGSF